jgi:murein DD-endopeptidase MepM/ murein hydrolase activator NlpD
MGIISSGSRALGRAFLICVGGALVASCAEGPQVAAPVLMKGGPGDLGSAAMAPTAGAAPRRETQHITVRPGQSLSGIAHTYHVPERTIIEANHLKPPYKLEAGVRLLIPGALVSPLRQASVARTPLSPAGPAPTIAPPASPEVIALDGPGPLRPGSAPPRPPAPPQTEAAAAVAAEVARETASSPTPSAGPKAPELRPAGPVAHEEAAAAPEIHGGRYPWPVRGRVLAGFGTAAGGSHNDGVNIGAARGTPIKAIDGGIVAYAGNELRGYGNLVLVKHANGWISAYAHCEELLVKKGDKVSPGQIIGKVGNTGGVTEPQLHFELRRGKQPVDPKEFLGPAPSAEATATRHG